MTQTRTPVTPKKILLTFGAVAALAAACSGQTTSSPSTRASLPSTTSRPSSAATSAVATPRATSSLPSTAPTATATTALPEACTVVATGLFNPRGITVTNDGTLYIAEAGDGGDIPDFPSVPASPGTSPSASPAGSPAPVTTHGDTGRVSLVSPDGTQAIVADGLTSYNFGTEVVGPADVAVSNDGTVYVSIGGPGPGLAAIVPAGNADSVVTIDSTGTVTELADLGAAERAGNPDPNAIDSNVSGIALGADGLLYVADAGGNDIYTVDPQTGDVQLVAVFEGLPSIDGAPNPARGGAAEVDPVPTDVVADPDGGVFVGFLTGAALWATPGSAKVVHVDPDGTVTDAATDLSTVVGVAVRGGDLFASQLSANLLQPPPPAPGTVERALESGPESVLTDLPLPYGIAFGPDGSLYVAIKASAPAGTPPQGQVLKCEIPTGGGPGQTQPPTSPKPSQTPEPSRPAVTPSATRPPASVPASPSATSTP